MQSYSIYFSSWALNSPSSGRHLLYVTGFGKTLCKGSVCDSCNARFQVEIHQSPDSVIYMSNNPSSNCCCHLRRLVVLYKGEISLHFDLPSQHSCCTQSPLLWGLIIIPTSRLSRYSYIHQTTVSLLTF